MTTITHFEASIVQSDSLHFSAAHNANILSNISIHIEKAFNANFYPLEKTISGI